MPKFRTCARQSATRGHVTARYSETELEGVVIDAGAVAGGSTKLVRPKDFPSLLGG
jgi:hypothetical protein